MKSRMILAASIALAFAVPAFAQDSQTTPAPQPDEQAAPADAQPMNADVQQPAPTTKHHRMRHHRAAQNNANMALSGNEPRIVAYQNSPEMKAYPAVDHGHVPGDPPIIDHSGDQSNVQPKSTTITVPPGH